jgi:hypothetical protein
LARPRAEHPRTKVTNLRLTEQERDEFEAKAEELGLKNVSEYIRFLHDVFAEREQAEEATLGSGPIDFRRVA